MTSPRKCPWLRPSLHRRNDATVRLNKRDSLATRKTLVLPAGEAVPFSSFQFPTCHGEHFAHHWVVRWDLADGETHLQETLPHPIVHICAESGTGARRGSLRGAYVQGVVTRRFTRLIAGRGRVFGTKVLPGTLRAFSSAPLAALRDRVVPLADFIGKSAARAFEAAAGNEREDDEACAQAVDEFWAERLAKPTEEVALVQRIVATIDPDRDLQRVDDVVARFGVSKRELQRRFLDAVGLPPKLVIRRARLQDALLRLAGREDLTTIAHDLGYADSAHFSRELKATIGISPSRYRRGWES
jgi:AraC-like DNA-binding protein